MEVIEAIRRKRAVRRYTGQPLPEEAVRRILYAGRRAQSSKNSQPWRFIAIRERKTLEELAKMGDFARHLPTAALAVAILMPDYTQRWSIAFDAGQAAAYMQLAAVELGIGSCLVTLHRPEPARALLGFREDLHLHVLVAFGYPADPRALEPASQPGGRQPAEEIAYFEHWGR